MLTIITFILLEIFLLSMIYLRLKNTWSEYTRKERLFVLGLSLMGSNEILNIILQLWFI